MHFVLKKCVGALLIIVAIASGAAPSQVVAAPLPKASKERAPLEISILPKFKPDETQGAFAIRVGDIFAAPEMAKTAEEINDVLTLSRKEVAKVIGLPFLVPFKIQDVEQITGLIRLTVHADPLTGGSFMMMPTTLRMKKAVDWVALMKESYPEVEVVEHNFRTYFRTEWRLDKDKEPMPLHFAVVDERTLMLVGYEDKESCEKALLNSEQPAWAADWKEMQNGLFAAVIQHPRRAFTERFQDFVLRNDVEPDLKERTEIQMKVYRSASKMTLGIDTSAGLTLKARLTCDENSDAVDLEKMFAPFVTKGRLYAKALPRPAESDPVDAKAAFQLQKAVLESAALKRDGKVLTLTVNSKGAGLQALQTLLVSGGSKLAASSNSRPSDQGMGGPPPYVPTAPIAPPPGMVSPVGMAPPPGYAPNTATPPRVPNARPVYFDPNVPRGPEPKFDIPQPKELPVRGKY